jgi:hypothetical protein
MPRENAAPPQMPPECCEDGEPVLGRQQYLEGKIRDDHQPEFAAGKVEIPHVTAFEPQAVGNAGRHWRHGTRNGAARDDRASMKVSIGICSGRVWPITASDRSP